MSIKWSNKWIRLFLNVLIWSLVFALPYLIDSSHSHPESFRSADRETEFFKLNLCSFFFWIASFYLNSNLLVPKLFYQKRYWFYALSLLLTFFVIMLLHTVLFRLIITTAPFIFLGAFRFNFPAFLLTIAVSMAFKMSVDKSRADKLQMQKIQENMKTELSFLRSQISPHFLLNVLNNIVALNRLKSDELEPTLMKLSGLMQYMLYETDEEKVLLKTEAEYLQSYVELQQQRYGAKVKVNLLISPLNEWDEIEPMLLIPFIENAFKHGVGLIKDPAIDIQLRSDGQNGLIFRVANSYDPDASGIKDKTSGIGLANVTKRLNILYGNNHNLSIKKENGIFEVVLTIKLNT